MSKHFKICIFGLFFLLGVSFAQGQSIGKPYFQGESFCPDSQIEIGFEVTRGIEYYWYGWELRYRIIHFDTDTKYQVYLDVPGKSPELLKTFSNKSGTSGWFSSRTIQETIRLPKELLEGTDYRIWIKSSNPSASSDRSKGFQIEGIDMPIAEYEPQFCIGKPIQLTASSILGASYSWFGPNGFSSSEQNPVINNSENAAGDYYVTATVNGCSSSAAKVVVDPYPSNLGDENRKGEDAWFGHVYDGREFDHYIGSYTEPEVFDQDFGGDFNCFGLSTGAESFYTETYSINYKMLSSRKGLYVVDIGSDDGSRLHIDGKEVYNSWGEQVYRERENVLMSLTGESQLELQFYENGGANRIHFSEPRLLMENTLTTNIEQDLCSGSAQKISGDSFGQLPAGVSVAGYQWYYSRSLEDEKILIPGATSASFTPDMDLLQYISAGTYYVFREVRVLGVNNFGGKDYYASHMSNPAVIEVAEEITSNEISFTGSTETGVVSATAEEGGILKIRAPEGAVFTSVKFASFGTPEGTNGNFSRGWCHASGSESIVEDKLKGKNYAEISVNRATFGNPGQWLCEYLPLWLYVTAEYTYKVPECSGTDQVTMDATQPKGGNGTYTYLWESSIEGPDKGFSPASGENDLVDYEPEILSETTWFKRTVYSGFCEDESNVIKIEVEQNVWTGSKNEKWHESENWSCGMVPTLDTDALIPGGLENYPLISEADNNAKVRNLNIDTGASVEVEQNWFLIAGEINSSGSLKAVSGSFGFLGEDPQVIPGNSFENNRLANLRVENPAGAELQGELEVTHTVNVVEGMLHSNGGLILVSDEKRTALINGSGNGEITGKVTMQRYLNPAFGYKYLSSPMKGATVGDLADYLELNDSFPNVYQYREDREDSSENDLSGWEAYLNTAAPLNPLEGYAVHFGAKKKAVTISLMGEVTNGPVNIRLSNTEGKYTQGFNLVGNPYPSPIDWNAKGWTRENVDDAIYFFTASDDDPYTGTYKSNVGEVSSDGKTAENNIIPSMQGFFVRVSDVGRVNFSMTNAVRVENFGQEFYKTAGRKTRKNLPLIRINARFENGSAADPTVIYFVHEASASFEKELDAMKMMNTDPNIPNLYSLTPAKEQLSINAQRLSAFQDVRIAVGLRTERSGKMSIGLQDFENLPTGVEVYLIDLQKRMTKKLSEEGETYKFQIEEGVHDSRFELFLSEDPLEDIAVAFKEPFSVRSENSSAIVKLNLEKGKRGVLRLVSLSGQVLEEKIASGKEEVIFRSIKSAGIYVVNLDLGDKRHSKKVLIN